MLLLRGSLDPHAQSSGIQVTWGHLIGRFTFCSADSDCFALKPVKDQSWVRASWLDLGGGRSEALPRIFPLQALLFKMPQNPPKAIIVLRCGTRMRIASLPRAFTKVVDLGPPNLSSSNTQAQAAATSDIPRPRAHPLAHAIYRTLCQKPQGLCSSGTPPTLSTHHPARVTPAPSSWPFAPELEPRLCTTPICLQSVRRLRN